MAERPVGFGFVGTGMAGITHADEMPHVDGGELVAVCSRNEQSVRKFADEYDVPRWHTSYQELIRDPAVDVVCVLSPTGTHREVAIATAEAGKHLVIEKPLEIDLARADDIIRACRDTGTKLAVIFQMRFGHVARTVKRAIDSGAFGKIFLADIIDKGSRTSAYYDAAAWRGTRQLEGGGCLMTQSIHVTDLIQWLVGPVRSVVGHVATNRHAIDVEDTAMALLEFECGARGILQSTTSVVPALKSRVEIHGTKGSAVVNVQYDKFLVWNVSEFSEEVDVEQSFDFLDIDDPWEFPQIRHRVQLQDMVDAIREDREPILSGQEARKSLAINMAIYESSARGEKVLLSEVEPGRGD